MSLTKDEVQALMEVVGDAIKTHVMVPTDARLRAIEKKLGIPSPPSTPSTDDELVAQLLAAMDEQQ